MALLGISGKPSHASAMKLFTKAHQELQAAQEVNAAEKADAEAKLAICNSEETKLQTALNFMDNLFGTSTSTASQEVTTDA